MKLGRCYITLRDGRPCKPSGYVDVPVFMTFREYYGITDDYLRKWSSDSSDAVDFVTAVVEHVLNRFDSREFFFEKSPTNAYCMTMAAETLPGVRLVHMIRDGRDVVPSLMRRGWNLFGAGSRWLYDTVAALNARDSADITKSDTKISSPIQSAH